MRFMIDIPDMEEKPSACYKCPFGYSGLVCDECLVNGERIGDLREVPEWCPLVEAEEVSYDFSYEGKRKDMWYESAAFFKSLDDAKAAIANLRADDDRWHDFQVTESVEFESVVYEEE